MPLFVYQFPVTVLAAIILGTVGLLMEGWNESAVGDISGPFGWIRKGSSLSIHHLCFPLFWPLELLSPELVLHIT